MTGDKYNNILFPNIKWLPSRSAHPREAHIKFYNRIWAKNDPFWLSNTPGSLWNCKCDWIQTSEPVTAGNPPSSTQVSMPGLRGNPGITGQVFSNDAPYYRQAGENALTRKAIEKQCQSIERNSLQKQPQNNPLITTSAPASLTEDINITIDIKEWGIKETAQAMFGHSLFWLKNQLLVNFDKYLSNAKYLGSLPVDLTHNTGKILRLKRQLKAFHYFSVTIEHSSFCCHIAEHNNGKYYLYTITKNSPI